jgi:hypothetical protein
VAYALGTTMYRNDSPSCSVAVGSPSTTLTALIWTAILPVAVSASVMKMGGGSCTRYCRDVAKGGGVA